MLSAYDPWVNMLRTTVAAFSAGVGGADAITVVPFDSPLGRPDTFGRRIARNTSAVLLAEAQLGRVGDPAGGAYAVERLTHDVAVAAWELFGRLDDGAPIDALVAATVEERDRQVATRRRPLTGLTEFPHLAETLPVREPDPDAPVVRRYGAAFEALRDDPVEHPVFLATLGPVAAHTARATFAANLLAAGGIAVVPAGATGGVEELRAAYAGQRVACLAGADAAYLGWGAEAAAALREAGAPARHHRRASRPTTPTTRAPRASTRWPSCTGRGRCWRDRAEELQRPWFRDGTSSLLNQRRGERRRGVDEPRGHRHLAALRTGPPRRPRRARHLARA